MEDRLTPALYLETTDLPLERCAAERVCVNTFRRVGVPAASEVLPAAPEPC